MSPGALALATLLGVAATAARAGSPSAPSPALTFTVVRGPGAEGCPGEDSLAARLARRLVPAASAPIPVADRIEVSITRTAGGYLAKVTALGLERGVREIVDVGPDCAGLAQALTLTLAMIADGRPVANAKQPPAVVAQHSRSWELGLDVMGTSQALGGWSAGLAMDGLWHPWPHLALGITALAMPRRTIARGPGVTRVSLWAGLADLCWGILPFGGRVFPALCGQVGIGALRGEAESYLDARTVWRQWLAAGGSLQVGLRIRGPLSVSAQAGRLFPLRNDHFTVGGLGQVYESGHPGWMGGAGLRLQIP